jgi:hypothetical protein
MDIRRKFWIVLTGAIAGMVVIACSCSSLVPTPTATVVPLATSAPLATLPPLPTMPPIATTAPIATEAPVATTAPVATSPATGGEAMPGLAGRWNDPQTTGTVTTILWTNNQYIVQSVINPSRGGNEVTKTSWAAGVLTWTYCVPGGNCITSVTVSVSGNNLDTVWTDDQGNSGQDTLTRAP